MTTLREAAQRAMKSLEDAIKTWTEEMEFRSCVDVADSWIESAAALREALAHPEQEPVAWECKAGGLKPLTQAQYDNQTDNIKRHYSRIPHRKWQGLTDYEINNFDLPESGTVTIRKFVQIIEAKLKEKNT